MADGQVAANTVQAPGGMLRTGGLDRPPRKRRRVAPLDAEDDMLRPPDAPEIVIEEENLEQLPPEILPAEFNWELSPGELQCMAEVEKLRDTEYAKLQDLQGVVQNVSDANKAAAEEKKREVRAGELGDFLNTEK